MVSSVGLALTCLLLATLHWTQAESMDSANGANSRPFASHQRLSLMESNASRALLSPEPSPSPSSPMERQKLVRIGLSNAPDNESTDSTAPPPPTPPPFTTTDEEVEYLLGPIRDPMSTVIPMTLVYSVILITGLVGNVCTCTVIARNKYMHTTVNYYLFSLSISDLLLLVLGLPQELWMLWQKYPYVFGESFCVLRAMTSETCTNASVLTITAFTVERYIAICHPLKAHTMASLPRAIKTILCIWAISALCSVPISLQLGVIYQVSQITGQALETTGQCAVKRPIPRAFEAATAFFFVLPMTVISILYVLIGYQLRKSSRAMAAAKCNGSSSVTQPLHVPAALQHQDSSPTNVRVRSDSCVPGHHLRNGSNKHHAAASRRAVIKMLVAVVVSFFICWSPFHAQRVLATNIRDWNGPIMSFYQILTYISGVTYYLTATINPILYQLMSLKFRLAFKDTFGCWCPCLKAPEKHPDFSYSTVVVNGTMANGATGNDSLKYNASFRGSVSAHQLNLLNTRPSPSVSHKASSIIKCDMGDGNGNLAAKTTKTTNTLLAVPGANNASNGSNGSNGLGTVRSASCSDVFGNNARSCLLQASPSPSTLTIEAN